MKGTLVALILALSACAHRFEPQGTGSLYCSCPNPSRLTPESASCRVHGEAANPCGYLDCTWETMP
jgi:hypothetical protein